MNKSIKQIEAEIKGLETQRQAMVAKLEQAITNAIKELCQMPPMRYDCARNIVIIVANPKRVWNPEKYNWGESMAIVDKFLSGKTVDKWVPALTDKLKNRIHKEDVIFEYQPHPIVKPRSFTVSAEFIIRLIKYLQ